MGGMQNHNRLQRIDQLVACLADLLPDQQIAGQ